MARGGSHQRSGRGDGGARAHPQPASVRVAEPASAATLAGRVGLARQKVNYHLRALEAHKLVRVAEERQWGGLTERLLVATAKSYVVSPSAMGPVAADPARTADRLSASYLIALGARLIREVGDLWRLPAPPTSIWRRWRSIPRFASVPRPSAPRSPAS